METANGDWKMLLSPTDDAVIWCPQLPSILYFKQYNLKGTGSPPRRFSRRDFTQIFTSAVIRSALVTGVSKEMKRLIFSVFAS
jgi:hypothetical protein